MILLNHYNLWTTNTSGLCDVIWSTADKGAAVEPKDFSCVNRHLRNIKYAEGHSRVAIWKICMYIFMIWKYWGSKTQNFTNFMTKNPTKINLNFTRFVMCLCKNLDTLLIVGKLDSLHRIY